MLGDRRLERWLGRIAVVWLVALPTLRPVIWSGDATDDSNLFYLSLLGAAIATGLLQRALRGVALAPTWPFGLGALFLAIAAIGCWRSPVPASAWATWSAWALHLAAAVALAAQARRTPRALLAGLLTGLAIEGLVLAGQVQVERANLQVQLAIDPALVDRSQRDQFLTRAWSWRLEGSFLLANTLAAYVIIVLPLAVACAWQAWRQRLEGRWALSTLALLAAVALARTGSKAGMLSVLIAGAITAVLAWRSPGRRLMALGVGASVIAVALAVPAVRAGLAASAGVRLDYWRGALALVGERPLTGHGIDGFRVHFPRVKPAACEETVIAHNEVLQAAVDLGIPAAILLVAWWAAMLARLRTRAAIPSNAAGSARVGPSVALAVVAMMAMCAWSGGIVDADLWPGRTATAPTVAICLVTFLILCGLRLPSVPRWAVFTGAIACLLHACVDFHLHSAQVVGILALTVVSSPPRLSVPVLASRHQRSLLVAAALGVLFAVFFGSLHAATRSLDTERAQAAEAALRRLRLAVLGERSEDEVAQAQVGIALALHGYPLTADELVGAPDLTLARLAVADVLAQCTSWPEDPLLAGTLTAIVDHAVVLHPEEVGAFTAPVLSVAERWPEQVTLAQAASIQLRRAASREQGEACLALRREAQRWAQRAVDLYPTHPLLRADLAALAEANGDLATATREREAIERLRLIMQAVNRE